MITITCQGVSAVIDEVGAEMKSLKKDGVEFLRHDPADGWQSTAPVLFPICGGLKDDYFIRDGKKYTLPKHGFAKLRRFRAEKTAENQAVFTLSPEVGDTDIYPYEYLFTVTFTLNEKGVTVDYTTRNKGEEVMYFSVGGHEAYATPEGLEAYKISFEKPETVSIYSVTGPLLDGGSKPFLKNRTTFGLSPELFAVDALIFRDLLSRKAVLEGPSRRIRLNFEGQDDLLVWTLPDGSKYVCLEPWCGLPDTTESDHNLAHRPDIIALDPGCVTSRRHIIEVENL